MKFLRFLLFPFALIYDLITSVRNRLFDFGWLESESFDVPVISVGNLSVGGTGKTPHVEYLIQLLNTEYKVAVLSRGYKRKSKGFVLATENATVADLGDEPFQYHQKFKNVQVAVDANRRRGIRLLLESSSKPDVILLDDAFQHRYVLPQLQILLTTFDQPFTNDWLLPTGNLRESAAGAKRASAIIVTKCPPTLTAKQQQPFISAFANYSNAPVFFSSIDYASQTSGDMLFESSELKRFSKVVFTGIANPKYFIETVKNTADTVFKFPDHYDLTPGEIATIQKQGTVFLTTEKDYVRVRASWKDNNLCYLPINIRFLEKEADFKNLILSNLNSKL